MTGTSAVLSMKESPRPLADHVTDFLDWIDIEKGLAAKSQENYSRFLHKFIEWLIKSKLDTLRPHELTPEHIWQYRLYLSRRCLTPAGLALKKSTQNYYLIALRMFLKFFAHRNITSLSADKIPLAREKDDRKVRFLGLDQLERLFQAPSADNLQGLRDRAIMAAFFSTGMRISELTALNRNQVKVSETDETFELSIIGKGKRNRVVYFSPRALKTLKIYLSKRHDLNQALFVSSPSPKGVVTRLSPRAIEKFFKKYVISAGLPLDTTPHVMRHSFATNLLKQGVDLRIIQDFLGHKNIAATQMYAHTTSKQLRDIHKHIHGK